MSNRLRCLLAALLAMMSGAAAVAATPSFRILYHEKIVLRKSIGAGAAERVSFEAYGRHFDLLLSPNVRMKRALPQLTGKVEPMQGTVENAPGSWARLTRSATGWRGMFSDGQNLYAIEPAGDVTDAVTQPLESPASDPIVYRLDDALLPLEEAFCATPLTPVPDEAPATAAKVFKSLAAELQQQAVGNPDRQIRVGVVADYEFSQAFTLETSPEEAIVARMNVVDGIFSTQVGVKVELAEPTVFRSANDPFTRSSADNLLDELRRYRRDTPAQLAFGLTHLMTGRNLTGDTVGIAYLGSVCGGGSASSLSEGSRSTISAALIAAHEIGHNFNAPHDGENGTACAAVPQNFLMAPRLNGSDNFSACSLTQIQPTVNAASCLTPYTPPDTSIGIASGTTLSTTVDTPFSAALSVIAIGDDSSSDVVATINVPVGLTAQSATMQGGTCSTGETVSCAIGTLTAGETRSISLGLIASTAGSYVVPYAVDSSNDSVSSNNSGSVTFAISNVAPVLPPTQGSTGGGTGGGGGGGRLDFALLMLLGAALAGSRRRAS